VIVGCPPGEWHAFTPLLLSLFLRRRGLNAIYLGANVPVSQFSDTVRNSKANLVILVAQQLTSAATLQQTALALSTAKIPVAFGGRIFNLHSDLAESISGNFLGYDPNAALDEIEVILNNKVEQRQPKTASQLYVAAHQAFISKRDQIELTVKESLEPLSIAPEDIKTGIHFLGENITAALQLGDMAYVSAEVEWLKVLLQSYEIPPQQLIHFMETYSQAVNKKINGQGKPIIEWFTAEIEKLRAP
jgi:hypothetical protein